MPKMNFSSDFTAMTILLIPHLNFGTVLYFMLSTFSEREDFCFACNEETKQSKTLFDTNIQQ